MRIQQFMLIRRRRRIQSVDIVLAALNYTSRNGRSSPPNLSGSEQTSSLKANSADHATTRLIRRHLVEPSRLPYITPLPVGQTSCGGNTKIKHRDLNIDRKMTLGRINQHRHTNLCAVTIISDRIDSAQAVRNMCDATILVRSLRRFFVFFDENRPSLMGIITTFAAHSQQPSATG